jgi:ECF sigma factor
MAGVSVRAPHEGRSLRWCVDGRRARRDSRGPLLSMLDLHFHAISHVFERHRKALSALARRRLLAHGIPEVEYSGEDVVQSSFRTFLQEIIEGRIAYIADEDGTLKIVQQIIADKVSERGARMRSLKRDPSRIAGFVGKVLRIASVVHGIGDNDRGRLADDVNLLRSGVAADEVDFISQEVVAQLLDMLDAEHRSIAKMRFDGVRITEIAIRLGQSKRTIDRRLEEIRTTWKGSGLVDNGRG